MALNPERSERLWNGERFVSRPLFRGGVSVQRLRSACGGVALPLRVDERAFHGALQLVVNRGPSAVTKPMRGGLRSQRRALHPEVVRGVLGRANPKPMCAPCGAKLSLAPVQTAMQRNRRVLALATGRQAGGERAA
jgi:hypothetical protein